MPELQPDTRRALVDALLDLPIIHSEAGRSVLVYDWPRALRNRIMLAGPPALVIEALVDVAARWEASGDTLTPLLLLLDAAQHEASGTRLAEHLAALRAAVETELQQLTPSSPPAIACPSSGPFSLPYPRNPCFVGREAELARLETLFQDGTIPALAGSGGLGKTQLAVEYAYRAHAAGRYPGGIFWLTLDPPESIPSQVAALAGPGGLAIPNWDPTAFAHNLATVRAAWQEPVARLLIFDNCEDPALLREWRPHIGGCRVLLTTRRTRWPALSGVRALPLDPLPRALSLDLLLTPRAQLRGATVPLLLADLQNAWAAAAICEELGDLPLALALAAAYLETEEFLSLPSYYARLRAESLAHRSLNPQHPLEPLPTGHVPSLAATFALSYDRLDAAHPVDAGARTLLHRAAHAAPAPLPRPLLLRLCADPPAGEDGLEAGPPAELTGAALARLVSLGLIEPLPDETYRLHRLIAAFARDRAPDPAADAAALTRALISGVYAVTEAGYPLAGLPYLDHLRQAAAPAGPDAATLLNSLASLLQAQGNYTAARPAFEQALALREQALSPTHVLLAASLNNLAALLYAQGDYVATRPLYERALAIREQALGPDHPETASSLTNLASLLQDQGHYANARPLYARALAIYERQLGPRHPLTATGLNNLAHLLQAQGDYSAAQSLYERALAIRREVFGPGHPATATSLHNLASLLQARGDTAAARPLYEQALALCEATLGPQHPNTASSLNNLAGLLQAQGDPAAARPLYERALAIREQVFGSLHPATATSFNNLASLLQAQGDYAAARPLYEQALAIREQVFGPLHPATATSLNNLAGLFQEQGALAAARPLFERALAIREQALGPAHPLTAGSLHNLARLLQAQGDPIPARPLLERALAIRAQVLGLLHPATAQSLHHLARLLLDLGDGATADDLYAGALVAYEQLIGPDHPATLALRKKRDALLPHPPPDHTLLTCAA